MTKRVARWVFFVPFVALLMLVVWMDQNREQQTCEEAQAGRAVLREVVTIATEGNGSTDLTGVPGFDQLDAETQVFLENLAVVTAGSDSRETLRARLLDAIPEIEC